MSNVLVSSAQLSNIFHISEFTIKSLVRMRKIPHTFSPLPNAPNKQVLRFDLQDISNWLQSQPSFSLSEEHLVINSFREKFQTLFPASVQALQTFDRDYTAHKAKKNFNLVRVASKKYGFLFYVRYIHNGKMIPSKWNTHTNSFQQAVLFAQANRESIIAQYLAKHQNPYSILESYYRRGSPFLSIDEKRNHLLSEKTRSVYFNFVTKVFIPFLKQNNIRSFIDITPPVVTNFQDSLLLKGNKPQTINRYLGCLNTIFSHLFMRGFIDSNVFDRIPMLSVISENFSVRGCFDISRIRGVFDAVWKDTLSYLLCLLIYSTGMRNSEIERLQVKHIRRIDSCYFIDITHSKTNAGIRLVPLHSFVFRKLSKYIKDTAKSPDDFIFSHNGGHNQSTLYRKAAVTMGARLGFSEGQLLDMHISFYSGRHFWKTLMNAYNLGSDIEEFFMGHKVSKDVSLLYNHRDKQGKQHLVSKAKRVFAILDKSFFKRSFSAGS